MATGAGVTRKGIGNQTKAVMCPCRNPDVPSHRGPGIVCSSYLPKATADQEIVQVKPIKNIKVAVVIAVTALTITEHLLSPGAILRALRVLNHLLLPSPEGGTATDPIAEMRKPRHRELKKLV